MDENLGYLISDTGRILRKAFDKRARRVGITRPQWRVLARLNREPGINQAPLAALLEVEPITLTRMIDRLQQAGMVERRNDPNDRRAWCLYLTEKAEPVLAQMQELADELHHDMMAGMQPNSGAQLTGLLTSLRDNLQA
ncbi:MAG: MarR family transcriptional regulator, partial [Pontixanthobacter sp.]